MKYNVYHNPRCRKSREAIKYLEDIGADFTVVKYLDQPFDQNTLSEVLSKINLKPSQILRKNELIWKKEFSKKNLTEEAILNLLIAHPQLIERPIVTTPESGVLARPIENLISFLK